MGDGFRRFNNYLKENKRFKFYTSYERLDYKYNSDN